MRPVHRRARCERAGAPLLRRAGGIATLGVLVVLLALTALSGAAIPASPDRVATRAYIPARYRLFSALLADFKKSAPIPAYIQRVASECPRVLAAAPHRPQIFAFFQEEIDAFFVVLAPRFAAPMLRFSHTVGRLHWSSGKLTRAIHADADLSLRETKEPIPSLCADYRAWAASGYKTLPPETKRLDKETPPRWGKSELGDINPGLWNKLSPYATKSLKKLGHATQRLEEKFGLVLISISLGASHELKKRLGFNGPVILKQYGAGSVSAMRNARRPIVPRSSSAATADLQAIVKWAVQESNLQPWA